MQERSPHNRVGEKKEKGNWDRICTPGRELWKRKCSLTRENASPAGEISVERESFRGSGENAASGLQQVEQREACTEGPSHCSPQPESTSAGAHRCSAVSNSLQPFGCSSPGSWDFPGKDTGVGCHLLLEQFSWTRDWTQVSFIAGGSFTFWAIWEGWALKPGLQRTDLGWSLQLSAWRLPKGAWSVTQAGAYAKRRPDPPLKPHC